jgi:hypothetical protein
MKPAVRVVVASAILLSGAHALSLSPAQIPNALPATDSVRWVAGWSASQQSLGDTQVTNATVRMIARVSIQEIAFVFVDNAFGTEA